ncbi:hypothetical protein GCM10022291_25640 [Postechiella marina]|uniref:Uncharacterized protein n=1 Tax=Postechiella marina TaxID=943941 RepID=A0ABP8CD77_9FLAO
MSAILLSLLFVLLIVFLLKKHIFYFFNTVVKSEIDSLKAVFKRNFDDDDDTINIANNTDSVNIEYQKEINNWKLKNNLKTLRYLSQMEFVYKDQNISKDNFQKYKDLKLDLRLSTIDISNRITKQGDKLKEQNIMDKKNSA